MRITLLLAAATVLSLVACDKKSTPPSTPPPSVNQNAIEQFGQRNALFGWQVFQQLHSEKPTENIIISPYSIHTALNMMLNGTATTTLSEGLNFLHHNTGALQEVNRQQQQIDIALLHHGGGAKVQIANAFFHDPARIAALPSYQTALDTAYSALWAAENFNTPAALQNINQWVATQTKQRIPKIIESISNDDVAFIINAIHFQADWAHAFATEMTNTRDFTLANGQKVAVPFVMADRDFSIAVSNDLQLVDLPFKGGQFSLSLIQPTQQSNQWINQITPAKVAQLYNSLSTGRAVVTFPKFELEFEEDLVETLMAIGLNSPFNPGLADFSAMGTALTGPDLYAKTVIHKTYLKVDEKGAEGAAVTSIGMATTSMPPYFGFENPFVITLRHIPSGTLLFLGKIADPR
ncbi:MAG: hypothetical protein LAT76_05070 [Schleiferiaceae bacterium]|nr:hypothetical protein [Schleiferiaceae bacterium]